MKVRATVYTFTDSNGNTYFSAVALTPTDTFTTGITYGYGRHAEYVIRDYLVATGQAHETMPLSDIDAIYIKSRKRDLPPMHNYSKV